MTAVTTVKKLALVSLVVAVLPLLAQWENLKTPGLRNKDGRVDLSAPAPKNAAGKPDLSGIWMIDATRRGPVNGKNGVGLERLMPRGERIPILPSAAKMLQQETGDPSERCLPDGVPEHMLAPIPFKIVQTPLLTLVLYEEFFVFRQIFTDGRSLPRDPQPAFFGYSVGRWEGDTFVVESNGFNETVKLDKHPHGPGLKTTERFERLDLGHMKMEFTAEDPEYYSRPWSVTTYYELQADDELMEHFCENERDLRHLVRP